MNKNLEKINDDLFAKFEGFEISKIQMAKVIGVSRTTGAIHPEKPQNGPAKLDERDDTTNQIMMWCWEGCSDDAAADMGTETTILGN